MEGGGGPSNRSFYSFLQIWNVPGILVAKVSKLVNIVSQYENVFVIKMTYPGYNFINKINCKKRSTTKVQHSKTVP
jgi:hypothetical protein